MNNHDDIHSKLQYFISTKKIPNIIFHGESGSGKRTILNDFLQHIYDGDRQKMKTHIMTVECCHGKGIKFIREDLKFFAKAHIQSNHGANFKTIVLLNADSLTIDAQSALRRCIELFSHNTRFFILVENKERLLNPILSRFCEIYVSAGNRKTMAVAPLDSDMVQRFQATMANPCFSSLQDLVTTSVQWCEHGYSAHDWVQCLDKNPLDLVVLGSRSDKVASNLCEGYGYQKPSDKNPLDLVVEGCENQKPSDKNPKNIYITLCYHKIKPDFRCEKMLMFYVLYFTFVSSKRDLENMLL